MKSTIFGPCSRKASIFEGSAPSPAMSWDAVPAGTQTFALIMHDPDPVLNKSSNDVLHWAIFDIPGDAKGLPEGVKNGDQADGSKHSKSPDYSTEKSGLNHKDDSESSD